MSSPPSSPPQQIPPWLQSEITTLQQSQQNLQSIMTQIQHIGLEKAEAQKAMEELNKASDEEVIFKHAGPIMIKSTKQALVAELEERAEMAKTRLTVLEKQQARLKESLTEQEKKITTMMQGAATGQSTNQPTASTATTASLSSNTTRPEENPRK